MRLRGWMAAAIGRAALPVHFCVLCLLAVTLPSCSHTLSFPLSLSLSLFIELMFLETSALTGEGVEEVFLKNARSILTKIETGQIDPERMGSGIQYGDNAPRRAVRPEDDVLGSKGCSC